jgi:hypothetical protein
MAGEGWLPKQRTSKRIGGSTVERFVVEVKLTRVDYGCCAFVLNHEASFDAQHNTVKDYQMAVASSDGSGRDASDRARMV